jgi:phage gp46-like protein
MADNSPLPPPGPKLDITLGNRNPATGRFNFVRGADGDVSFDATQQHAVVTSALEDKNAYWADFNHGSDLHTLESINARTESQAEAMVLDAEAPLVQANIVSSLTATAVPDRQHGRLGIDVHYKTPAGAQKVSL